MTHAKPILLLLPGSLCDQRVFAAQITEFSNKFTVHVCDLSSYSSIDDMAQAVLATTNHNFALVGLSMGGLVALRILELAPQRVSKLALLGCNPRQSTNEQIVARATQIERVKAEGERALVSIISDLAPRYFRNSQNSSTHLQLAIDMALKAGPRVLVNHWEAVNTRQDLFNNLKEINHKTLILAGEHDALCPPKLQQEIAAELPNSQLCILPNCGHLCTIEVADAVNRELTTLFEYHEKAYA